jgi:hypothetical protein
MINIDNDLLDRNRSVEFRDLENYRKSQILLFLYKMNVYGCES